MLENDRNSLEKGNYTTKIFDSFHTYKGDRKKANRGVFKLLRLKSNRTLRNFKARTTKRVQRCSKCKKVGHNSKNKMCPANVDLTDMIEDEAAEDHMDILEAQPDGREGQDARDDETFASVEDLLNSDDELF